MVGQSGSRLSIESVKTGVLDFIHDDADNSFSGQLKVNFRPLYQDTIGVLTELAEQHAELIWEATFGQLEHCMPEKAADLRLVAKPAWASSEDAEEEEESTEELKGFHCPNASRLDRAVEDEVEGEPTAAADQSVTVSPFRAKHRQWSANGVPFLIIGASHL